MGDLRMGLFHQMEGTIRGHLAEASRRASRGDRFEVQKQAMINLGVPEAVAEDRAKALFLFAEGTPITSLTTCPRSLAGRPAASNSLPPTVPQRSPDAQARSRPGLPPRPTTTSGGRMTIAVYAATGASGHIGRFAVKQLLARGAAASDVVAVVCTGARSPASPRARASWAGTR
jgi:hypothetical protein